MVNASIIVLAVVAIVGVLLTIYITRYSRDCEVDWNPDWSECVPDEARTDPALKPKGSLLSPSPPLVGNNALISGQEHATWGRIARSNGTGRINGHSANLMMATRMAQDFKP